LEEEPPQQQPEQKDEPEAALILLACGVGLATGAAIVGFNIAVHEIRDIIWDGQSLMASNRTLLRNIGESELWPKVVFPPLLGGLAVGALGLAIGGFDDKPAPKLGKGKGSGSASSSSSGGGSISDNGGSIDDTTRSSSGASTSAAWEQWQLQAGAVARPVSRAIAAAITLGTGACWLLLSPPLLLVLVVQRLLLLQAFARCCCCRLRSCRLPSPVCGGGMHRSAPRSTAACLFPAAAAGASLGPEGPSVDIGKSVAKGLGSSLRSKERHITALLAAGSGAGVAAGFNAPVAGGAWAGVGTRIYIHVVSCL
jgi:H+/Cl- antiporter ClcA